MSQTSVTSQSTWRSKIKAMGPGILMASAAVGGSHIVSSTQAGGSYGWALLGLVILANLFKYPFFRFGAEYTADTGKTLVEGYAEKGKFYLWVFFILNVFSALVNTAGVSILCSAIIASAFPMLGLSITTWSIILVAIIWGMLLFGGYKLLDGMAKWIMSALTIATVAAVIIAAIKHPEYSADFVEKTPWQLAALPFIVSLLGWMPAPIEISAINSLWSAEKKKTVDFNTDDALFDFNVGYIGTAILGLIIIFFFQGQVATMLRFAMIGSFLTTPFFALLNYVLVTKEKKDLPTWLKGLAIAGLIFLFGFALFFIWALAIGKAG